jgi:hypothetical protein
MCPCGINSGKRIEILQVHFSCDTWQGVHYYLNSEDYSCHRLFATIITYRFCFLVRIETEKRSGNCHWKLYSCFYAFAFCDTYTGMVTVYFAALQDCPQLLLWLMNKWQFPFLLYASRIFPNKKMESAVKRKLSLVTFLWSYGRIFCHIWTHMSREYDIQCVCQGQLNLIFKNLFGMITEWSTTFHPNIQIIYVPLGNIHQHVDVVFTSLEQFVRIQTVKWSASFLQRHSNNLTCG